MARPVRLSRRQLLLAAGGVALACDSSRPRQGFLGAMERLNARAQAALFDPSVQAPELGPKMRSPPGAFPVYFVSPSLPLAPAGWVMLVGGLVAAPRAFSLADLMALPRTDLRVRHHCVEGWSAVAGWHGVTVRELARVVGASPRAEFVEFRSFDSGYHSSWDRGSALHAQTILAYGKDGEPLSAEYGAPLRLYSAVKLGYKMVKYVTELRFLDRETGGYWEDRGYEWFAGV